MMAAMIASVTALRLPLAALKRAFNQKLLRQFVEIP